MDDADPFDAVHGIEDENMQLGFEDGTRDGISAGIVEGRELGVQKGYEIGTEVGFYTGCVAMWRALHRVDGGLIPERAQRGVAALEELLSSFPLGDPQDERLHDALERVRGKFKAVASMLGLLQDYFPREPGAGPDATVSTGSAAAAAASLGY